jgi:prepilin peptidase CpaA
VNQVLPFPLAVVLVAALAAAVTDVLRFKVHNILTLPLLATGLIYHAAVGGSAGFAASLAGALLGFGVLIGFYLLGGMGGGDVKLLSAIGAWLGIQLTFWVFIVSSLAAGVYALALVLKHHMARETWTNLQIIWYRVAAIGRHLAAEDRVEAEVLRGDRRGRVVPFAAMVAVGVVVTLGWLVFGGGPR